MQPDEITSAVVSAIPDAKVEARMEGNHAHLVVISEQFDGLLPVKRQQLVYSALQAEIASGAIHAVHMKTFTPSQWAAAQ